LPSRCVSAVAGTDAAGAPRAHAFGDQRCAGSHAAGAVPASDSGARDTYASGAAACAAILAEFDFERRTGGTRQERAESRLLELFEVLFGHVDDDFGLPSSACRVAQLVLREFERARLRLGGGSGGVECILGVLFVGRALPIRRSSAPACAFQSDSAWCQRRHRGRLELAPRAVFGQAIVDGVDDGDHVALPHGSGRVRSGAR
jgi:hypothetical protein